MKKLICNQKMYLTYDEAIKLKNELDQLSNINNVDLILCPSYLNFDIFKGYKLSAQDAFYEDKGPFTGEISAYDLYLRGIKYSLVGHSERRIYDTDEMINLKVKTLLKHTMTPILCIGDTKIDKELRRTSEVLKKQLISAFKNVNMEKDDEILIAYEPRFLIGGKLTLNKWEIEDIFCYIKKVLSDLNIINYKLLYGGSVDSNNIKDILSDSIDGYLLGGASVNKDEIEKIISVIK